MLEFIEFISMYTVYYMFFLLICFIIMIIGVHNSVVDDEFIEVYWEIWHFYSFLYLTFCLFIRFCAMCVIIFHSYMYYDYVKWDLTYENYEVISDRNMRILFNFIDNTGGDLTLTDKTYRVFNAN